MPGIYDFPVEKLLDNAPKLTVAGLSAPVLSATVCMPPFVKSSKCGFAPFELLPGESVEISAVYGEYVDCAVVRPLSLGVVPKISADGSRVTFTLDRPARLSLEINEDPASALLLFASETEDAPDAESEQKAGRKLTYFGPGLHRAGVIRPGPDETLYFDGGAWVEGMIDASHADRLRVAGHGILDSSAYSRADGHGHAFYAEFCKDLRVEGITILDSPGWDLRLQGCEDVSVTNVKIIGRRANSDGIDVCGSRRVRVADSFVRGCDDCLVVKAFDTGDTRELLFENCVLWNDLARTIEVGYEHRADLVENVKFRNIDIIHALSGYPVTGIHHGDRAELRNIAFEDIRIEHAPGCQLFDINIRPALWTKGGEPGPIHGVLFDRISLVGEPGIDYLPEPPRVCGWSERARVYDVEVRDMRVNGKLIADGAELGMIVGPHAEAPRFTLSRGRTPAETPASVSADVALSEFSTNERGFYVGEITLSVVNTGESTESGRVWLAITPERRGEIPEDLAFTLKPHERASAAYRVELAPGRWLAAAQSDCVGLNRGYRIFDLPLALPGVDTSRPAGYALFDYPLVSYDGREAGTIAFADMTTSRGRGLFVTACVDDPGFSHFEDRELPDSVTVFPYTENIPLTRAAVRLWAATPAEPMPHEAAFARAETITGRASAYVCGEDGGTEQAPELRNVKEITLVFKNQPQTKITSVDIFPMPDGTAEVRGADGTVASSAAACEAKPGGYQLTAFVPYGALGIPDGAGEFLLEAAFDEELDGLARETTLAGALQPDECSHMFIKVRKQ